MCFVMEVFDFFLFDVVSWRENSDVIFLKSLIFQVLIPVFALGRAQELCILLETFW